MVRFFRCHILQSPRRVNAIILAFVLVLGFLTGSLCSGFADLSLSHLMHTAAQFRVSIVHLLPVILLPVVFSAFAVYIGHTWLLFPVAFLKAFLFGYLTSGIQAFYPDSGSLFAVLLLWTDYLSMPVLCWCWLQGIRGREAGLRAAGIAMLLILGIGFFDYQVVSPFLVSLLS